MQEATPIRIDYEITFADGESVEIEVRLDPKTLALVNDAQRDPPGWTKCSSIACPACPAHMKASATCPVAASLWGLMTRFTEHFSYDPVTVKVTTAERVILGQTTLQAALCSLIGLVMATSGCPVLDKLRPMARFHLPLATEHETIYRAASMYLVAQFMVAQAGGAPDWSLGGLETIYAQVHEVNRAIARRLREVATTDASANALVRLDLFTGDVAYSINDKLHELEYLFDAGYVR